MANCAGSLIRSWQPTTTHHHHHWVIKIHISLFKPLWLPPISGARTDTQDNPELNPNCYLLSRFSVINKYIGPFDLASVTLPCLLVYWVVVETTWHYVVNPRPGWQYSLLSQEKMCCGRWPDVELGWAGRGEEGEGVGTWEGPNWELADHGAGQTKRQRKLGNSCLLLAMIQN